MIDSPVREALQAQGFKSPGPKLIELVTDAIARESEVSLPGSRTRQFDYAEILVDTPELVDRTDGPLKDPGTEVRYVLADVLNKAKAFVFEDGG